MRVPNIHHAALLAVLVPRSQLLKTREGAKTSTSCNVVLNTFVCANGISISRERWIYHSSILAWFLCHKDEEACASPIARGSTEKKKEATTY